jgi:hypothetical protein
MGALVGCNNGVHLATLIDTVLLKCKLSHANSKLVVCHQNRQHFVSGEIVGYSNRERARWPSDLLGQ